MIIAITPDSPRQVLHGALASRRIEAAAAMGLPPHSLMQRAGQSVARLALSIAPTARRVWVLCGPGNNGGDGFEAALWLHRAGWQVHVTDLGQAQHRPSDAAGALTRALDAGVAIRREPPGFPVDVAIDALFGLGVSRALAPEHREAIERFNAFQGPRLAVDLPSGLDADTGMASGGVVARATDTLALLTLKPGLFTALGREFAGRVWFDDLGAGASRQAEPPTARTIGPDDASTVRRPRAHHGHKGSYGDVLVVGGAPGMDGALRLAARAALASGAGRVYACALDPGAPLLDWRTPEVMCRPLDWAPSARTAEMTVVAGCGGGDHIRSALPSLLSQARRLVLDADALNAIAADTGLQTLLSRRAGRDLETVLTPHPLEAARLLGHASTAAVQQDRPAAARTLAERFDCTVLLKGSGTVIAAPGEVSAINTTGNARLATPGAGDVLAGWLAGLWSCSRAGDTQVSPFDVASIASREHGLAADDGSSALRPLTASTLLQRMAAD